MQRNTGLLTNDEILRFLKELQVSKNLIFQGNEYSYLYISIDFIDNKNTIYATKHVAKHIGMTIRPKKSTIATLALACTSLFSVCISSSFGAQHTTEKTNKTHAAKTAPIANKSINKSVAKSSLAKSTQSVRKVLASSPTPRTTPVREPMEGPLSLASASALVFDTTTGNPVFQKNPHTVMPIASISKLMTAMVVLDAHLPMDEIITIGEEDVDTLKGSHSRLPVGAVMTRETAMLLALMSSDNRAAHALSRHYPGGLSAFVAAMNEKTAALGMSDSRFIEPTGLSSRNVSTAQDLARMVMAAANYAKIRELSTTTEAKIQIGSRQLDFHNTNALTRNTNWDIGVSKTGYISEAGRCLVMQAKVAERPVVIVLLDSVGKMTRVGDAVRIKKWMEQASSGRTSSRHA
jgi:D-alanyl-D-alanine endopeptidase (penicillin-binding protein 7)